MSIWRARIAAWGLSGLSYLLGGCEARFLDLRQAGESALVDGFGPIGDLAGQDLAGQDLAALPDKQLARGMFVGRAGHSGSGEGGLYRTQGAIELRLAADFSSSGVPGPALFLTSRDSMAGTIDTVADVNLGTLRAASGAQVYPLPSGADVGRRNVFVYCQPFRVEVAKATLVDLP
jgi:hypothetical protein